MLLALGILQKAAALVASRRVEVVGMSMYPTLAPGEYVLCDRFAYRRQAPRRGDVVLARGLAGGGETVVKRVAAVPGDRVELDDGTLVINGAPAQESAFSDGCGTWSLGENEWFLLGDAMDVSTDSRAFGPVPRRAIEARAWLVCWPLARWRRLDGERRDE